MTALRWLWLALVALVVMVALRLLRATWRIREVGQSPAGRCLVAFWHGDQIALTAAALRPTVLVSRSRDGEIAALAARMLGYEVTRGSTSHGAVAGTLGLARSLRRGEDAALAADGPRGPRHTATPSAARLAGISGASLVPVGVCLSRAWRLSSWDRMAIPAPFSSVCLAWGDANSEQPLQPRMQQVRQVAEQLLLEPGRQTADSDKSISGGLGESG